LQETLAKDENLREDLKSKMDLEEAIANTKKELKKFQKDDAADKKELAEMNEIREQIKKITDKNTATASEIAKLEEVLAQTKDEKAYDSVFFSSFISFFLSQINFNFLEKRRIRSRRSSLIPVRPKRAIPRRRSRI
jgi:hypothetical protein